MTRDKLKDKLNRVLRTITAVLLCGLIIMGAAENVRADVATDYLTVKVGYSGMKLSEYVEAGNYHWRDLRDNLELHKVAYSYFQSSGKKHYTAIVDSAQGFYISDILDLANIYYGDVKSLKFYVEDSKGIRTSFDKGSLFASRYYYDDLAGNRTVVYGKKTVTEEEIETVHHDAVYETETYTDEETGEEMTREVLVSEAYDEEIVHKSDKEVTDKSKIVEYKFDEAARHAEQVQPMLAIEDNWAQFSEEFEHIGPDFTSMNAGNRFRLLFGQTSPTESLTSKSDKYVSCVYVTLSGKPTIGDMGELDGKIGSHTVEMTVSSDNVNIRDALSELMNVNSTNTDVLVITGIDVTPVIGYSDLAKVTVKYDVVGDGEASLTVGVGSDDDSVIAVKNVNSGKDPGNRNTEDEKSGEEKKGGSGTEGEGGSKGSLDNKNKNTNVKSDTEEVRNEREVRETGTIQAYQLSDAAAQKIQSSLLDRPEVAAMEEEDIEQLTIEDNSEEEKEEQRRMLALTGLGMLVIGTGGGAAELLSFNIRLKGRKVLQRASKKTA